MRTLSRSLVLGALLVVSAGCGARAAEPVADHFLRDYAETRGFTLGRPTRAQPTPDGKAVLFLRAQARSASLQLFEFDVATRQTTLRLTPEQVLGGATEQLSPEEKARRERMRVSVGGFTDFQLSRDGAQILVSLSGRLFVVPRASGAARELKTGPGTLLDPQFSPDGRSVAYVRDADVYVYDLARQREQRITTGGTERVTHGLAEFVAQEEMGRFSGFWWSPDSRFIAYEEADARAVETWFVSDPAKPGDAPRPSYYPRPGKTNVTVRLGVVPVRGGPTVWIQWDGKRHPYLGSVRWDDTGPLTVTLQSREQQELVLLAADPRTGVTTQLVAEHDAAWVHLDQSVPRWLTGGRGFLWTSDRDGAPQLEWRTPAGALHRVLVPPWAGFQGLVDVAPESVVFRASVDPTQSQLHRVSLDGGAPVALTHATGQHAATFAKDHSLYVHQVTTPQSMVRSMVCRADGTELGELPSVAEPVPFTPRAEFLKVGDGDGFYAVVVRPRDFDPAKRYPVIDDVYGGPGFVEVSTAMSALLMKQWLADQGFIVVSLDGRGTPGRGRDWERAIAKHFGTVPLADQIAGLRALAARFPEMDLHRAGIVGWSFGGYLSALAVLREPEVFQAAVAGAPVVDWLDYDTHYTERYLGLPGTEAEAYREGSLLTYAASLRRPLLLLHGTADDNVYFRHTLKLADALFRAGKDFELIPLPGMTHMTPDPVVAEQRGLHVARHFQKHLGAPVNVVK